MTVSHERHSWEEENYHKLTKKQQRGFISRTSGRKLAMEKEDKEYLSQTIPKIRINPSRSILLEPFISIVERKRRFKERYG